MGWIKPIKSYGFVLRVIVGFFAFILLIKIISHIQRLTFNGADRLESPIKRLLLHLNSSRTRANSNMLVIGKLPSLHTVNPHDRSPFNVSPVISTGSEDLDFPLKEDIPELVRRVLANLTVSVSPLNQPAFRILIPNANKCHASSLRFKSQPDLLVLVKSAPSHFKLRDAIRLGWGDENCWGGRQIVRLFLLGTVSPKDSNTASLLQAESDLFGDIIQQDFLDDYHNNTYKILFGLNWAVEFCPTAPLIMFADDDFFVYPQNVVAYIEGLSEGIRDRLISGYVWSNAIPVRSLRTNHRKWFVDKKEFPGSHYPPYVAAGNFFVSMSMARELNVAARYTRYLRFDDVFLGIVLKKLVRVPIHLSRIYAFTPVNRTSAQIYQMISSHQFGDPVLQLETWDQLNCSHFCVRQ